VLGFLSKLFRRHSTPPAQADGPLPQGEETFRLLVEGVRDYAIFLLDPHGLVLTWNAGAERIKGYAAEEVVGQHFSRFYPPEDVQSGKPGRELGVAAATGKYEEEGWRVRKDGSRFWAGVVLTAVRDEGGALRGFAKVTTDLTERRRAEEDARRLLEEAAARRAAEASALEAERSRREERRQREQLRVTLSSIGDAVIVTDASGVVTFLNPVAERLTGWPQREAVGKPLATVFRIRNEQTRRPVENPAATVLATGVICGLANHTLLVARDGTERPIDDSGAPVRDEQGHVAGVVLVFRDVTERRRAEEARSRLAAIVESSEDAIIGKDLDGLITSWNTGAERLYGYTAEEVIGKPVSILVPPDHPDELPGIMGRLKRGERVEPFETVRVRKGGSRVDVSLTVSPIKNAAGEVVGASAIARDVTADKRAAEALRASEARKAAVLETALDAIITIDHEGKIVEFNPAAEKTFG
jgi:PAS domain S-box-containing protein